jgi:hypothetical protein
MVYTYFNTKQNSKESFDIIGIFFNRNPLFFLDSETPFNCLNENKKFVLPQEIFEKKIGKNKFYNEQKQVKKIKYIYRVTDEKPLTVYLTYSLSDLNK